MSSWNDTRFILVGFTFGLQTQTVVFVIFLLLYFISLMGNLSIIAAICLDQRLHTPMYYFLSSLACLDICFISSTLPKLLNVLASDNRFISSLACFLQFYFYVSLGTIEFYLLGVMSVDQYVVICQPLRYHAIITNKVCLWLILVSWIGGFFTFIYPTFLMFNLSFCGPHDIKHFFCDSSAVVNISCSDTHIFDLVFSITASAVIIGSLIMTLVSYFNILITVLKKQSGRKKAFSTCTSHFTVVFLVYGSAMFIYVRPVESSSPNLNKVVALLNSIMTALVNPFIYSLRNKQVQDVLCNVRTKLVAFLHS